MSLLTCANNLKGNDYAVDFLHAMYVAYYILKHKLVGDVQEA